MLRLPAVRCALGCALLLTIAPCAAAQDLAAFEKRVTVEMLDNGLTLIVCERPEAPVFSFFTHVDVGADREVPGITGIAHMFEHMAFKGTDTIGTTDYAAEKAALERVEEAYAAFDEERRKPIGRDEKRLAELEKAWRDAIAAADQYVVSNAFGEIIDREGGVGLNAYTNSDETGYFFSFPVNRLELWAYLESERFLKPVMREFYKERDVVMEERRMRTDSNPFGRLFEQALAASYIAHSYGRPVVGWMSDLQSFSATDARAFYDKYYIPANMIVAVVGDVKAAEVVSLVEKYFGRLPARARPDPVRTVEPPQLGERHVRLKESSQPVYLETYHRPSARDPDDAVYDVVGELLSRGRTSRLYRSLVRDKRIAAQAVGFAGFPGTKYPNLFLFGAIPVPGHTTAELQEAIRAEIERLKTEDVSKEELRMIKTRVKADLLRQLASNTGLAQQLAINHARLGDWREMFRQVDRIDAVTAAEVRRVANKTFVESNRTVAILDTQTPERGSR
jgi:predicted Zn-dependent peptidase